MRVIPCALVSVCTQLFYPCENLTINCTTRITDIKDTNVLHTFVANHSCCLINDCNYSKKWIEKLSGAMVDVAQKAIDEGYSDLNDYEPMYVTLRDNAPCLLFQNEGQGIFQMIFSFTKWLKTYDFM